VTVDIAAAYMFEYRFFVAIKYGQATEHYLMIQNWETNIHARVFHVSGESIQDFMRDHFLCSGLFYFSNYFSNCRCHLIIITRLVH